MMANKRAGKDRRWDQATRVGTWWREWPRMTRSYIKRTQRNKSWCLMIKEKRQIKSGVKRFWLGLSNWEGGRTSFCDRENSERSISGHVKFWVLELFKRRYLEGSCICEPSLGDRSALKTIDLGIFRTLMALRATDWMRLPFLFFLSFF